MLTVPGQAQQDGDEKPTYKIGAGLRGADESAQSPSIDTLLSATVRESHDVDPALAARVLEQQKRTGIDQDVIARNLDEIEKDSAAKDFNAIEYRKRNPKMAGWLAASPRHMAVVKDPEAQKALNDLERVWYRKDDLSRPLSEEEQDARATREAPRIEAMMKAFRDLDVRHRGKARPLSERPWERTDEQIKVAAKASALGHVKEREAFISGTEPLGIGDVFSGPGAKNLLSRIPMMGGVFEAIESGTLWQAAKASEAGTASQEEQDLLLDFARVSGAAERRGVSFWGGVTDMLASSAQFGTEVAATAGVYGSVKAGVQKTIRDGVKKVISGRAGSLAVKGVGTIVATGAQLAPQAGARIMAGTLNRLSPDTEIEERDGGLVAKVQKGTGDPWYAAIPYAVGDAFAEILSERAGGGIAELAPKGKVAGFLFGAWKKAQPDAGKATYQAFATFARKSGINGVLSEMGEEEFGKVLKSVISDGPAYTPPTDKELLQEAVGFGIAPAIGSIGGSFETRRQKAKAKQMSDVFKTAGMDVDALEKAGVPMPVIKDVLGISVRGTKAENVYVDVDALVKTLSGSKDEEGNPIDVRAAIGKVLGSTEAFDLAAISWAPVKIPTVEYMTHPLLREKRDALDKEARLDPQEMNEREAESYFQSKQEDEKRGAEIDQKVEEAVAAKEPEIQKKAMELSKQEAKANLASLLETDIISRLENEVGTRVYWNRDGRNAEEIVQSGVPRHLLANPEEARKRGPGYAVPIDEAAATLGLESDEALVEALGKAAAARKEAEDASTSEFVDDRFYQGVAQRERAKARADISGEPGAYYDQAGADVREKLAAQFMAAGYAPEKANAYAELGEAFFRTQGIRSKIDPEELYRKLNLRIQKEGPRKRGALEQPGEKEGKEPLGSYSPASKLGGPTIINILKKANLSTALHEMGHLYLDVLVDLASGPAASDSLKADIQKIMDWFGVKDVEAWKALDIEGKRPHHEKWATTFESYLKEGKAPTVALRSAFARFKAWLLVVYKKLRGLPELNPEVKAVFDRMLATEEEIAHAAQEQNIVPIDPKVLGLSEDQEDAYVEQIGKAKARAEEELGVEMLRDVFRAQTAAYKEERERAKAEVAAEVDAEFPVYAARSALKDNTFPDGTPMEGDPIKLDSKAIVDRYGKERLKKFAFLHSKEGGLTPDQAAELLGFSSGDELLTAIETAEPRSAVIDRITNERMEERYGPPPSQEEIAEHAMDALHNEARGDLLALEARKIAERGGKKAVPRDALKAYAQKQIASQRWLDIQPGAYRRAEAKAAKEAFELASRGKYDEALQAKQREMLNHELYRESVRVRDEMRDKADSIRKYNKDSVRAAIGKAGGDYLDQLDGILERFDFRPLSGRQVERRKSLAAWVKEQEDADQPVQIDDELLSDAFRKHWKDLTFDEFRKVTDAIDNIAHLALFKDKLLKDAKKRAVSEVIDGGVASLLEHSRGPRKRVIQTHRPGEERKYGIEGWLASHRKLSSLVREMDGWKDGGYLWEALLRPINDAGNEEATRNAAASKRLSEIFALLKDSKVSEKTYIPAIQESLDREAMMAVALNWGNEDSREKVMAGYDWTEAQVQAILDNLTEKEWAFVRGIWTYINEFWPEIRDLNKRTTGLAPEKVEASPFMTRFGEVEGGYFPLKYDERQSERAGAKVAAEAAERIKTGGAVRATTRHGHRKARVDGVKQPVRLDFGVIFGHVSSVIHDLTHYEMLQDVNRIARSNRMQDAIRDHYGHEVYQQIKAALDDIATGDAPARTAFEKSMKALRVGTSIAAMGWNVTTAALQPLGLTQSMVRVGPKWVMRGLRAWMGSPKHMAEVAEMVYGKSEMMRNRGRTQQREINEVRNTINGGQLSKLEDSYFYLITVMQKVADVPTWLGAYEKARAEEVQEEGQTDAELDARAVALADQAVLDAQGGGQVKDLAQIQRGGPLMKLWTQFYSFFSTTYQLSVESVKKTRSASEAGRLAADFLLLFVVPSTLGYLLKAALRGGGDDDDRSLAEKLARENASYMVGTMVGLRELSGAIQGFHNYTGPAGARWAATLSKLWGQVEQGQVDSAAMKAAAEAAGILFHKPTGQIVRSLDGIRSIVEGETKNPAAVLFGAPKK